MIMADRDQQDLGVVIIFIFYIFMAKDFLFISSSISLWRI